MLAKLMTLLAATKGASVAAVVVLGAATVTVGASSPEIQDTVKQVIETVTGQTLGDETARALRNDCGHGQPAVVAQRNAATKLIDAAFQADQKRLERLRGKGVDNKAAGDLVKTADDTLKDLRTKALNDVAALTLGREGQNKPSGSPSPKPSASPCPSASPEVALLERPSGSPNVAGSAKPSQEGRVTVAERTTLDANVKAIVDKAITDMDALVTEAEATVGALPTADHGKPADNASEDRRPSGSPKH